MAVSAPARIATVDHGTVPVDDLGACHRFYTRLFGAELKSIVNLSVQRQRAGRAGIFFLRIAGHEIRRRYLALVRGAVAHDRFAVEAPLGRTRARIRVQHGTGKEAQTAFEVRERFEDATLLEASPRTGRTHQIRVHLSSIGHPVVGDRAYGGGGDDARRLGLERPFLHSWRLGFTHPVTHDLVELEEPLPADLEGALAAAFGQQSRQSAGAHGVERPEHGRLRPK